MESNLKFLQEYFRIPANKKIGWGIIETQEKDKDPVYALGIYIQNSNVYIDVGKRRFFSEVSNAMIKKKIHPARQIKSGFGCCYKAKDNPNIKIFRSKSYLADVYYTAIYSKDLEEDIIMY